MSRPGSKKYIYEVLEDGTRICHVCKVDKPITEFVIDRYLKGGRTRDCKPCRAERFRGPNRSWRAANPEAMEKYKEANRGTKGWQYRIKYNYKITPEQYHDQFTYQGGTCAICSGEIEVIDHDHDTGELRGLLCQTCNRGLGHFRDNIVLIKAATAYLESGGIWQ